MFCGCWVHFGNWLLLKQKNHIIGKQNGTRRQQKIGGENHFIRKQDKRRKSQKFACSFKSKKEGKTTHMKLLNPTVCTKISETKLTGWYYTLKKMSTLSVLFKNNGLLPSSTANTNILFWTFHEKRKQIFVVFDMI